MADIVLSTPLVLDTIVKYLVDYNDLPNSHLIISNLRVAIGNKYALDAIRPFFDDVSLKYKNKMKLESKFQRLIIHLQNDILLNRICCSCLCELLDLIEANLAFVKNNSFIDYGSFRVIRCVVYTNVDFLSTRQLNRVRDVYRKMSKINVQ